MAMLSTHLNAFSCAKEVPAGRATQPLLAQQALSPAGRGGSASFSGRPWQQKTKPRQSSRLKVASEKADAETQQRDRVHDRVAGLGDVLGPIGLTLGGDLKAEAAQSEGGKGSVAEAAGVSLGPISLSFGDDFDRGSSQRDAGCEDDAAAGASGAAPRSIASLSTDEWRARYEADGAVDLWLEEEFNAGSRLIGGRDVHKGGTAGLATGEGPSKGSVPVHTVKIYNHFAQQEIDVEVPEDRYILFEAEEQGLLLPWACRMGCCTACAVRVREGRMWQPQALGVSQELKDQGFALMCVGYPLTDLVLETVEEDEVYDMQFGKSFEVAATRPDLESVKRDDFALELADMDE